MRPAKMVKRRADDKRGVRHTRADDKIGASIERLRDPPRAKIGDGREDRLRVSIEALARLHTVQEDALFFERAKRAEDIVALDMRHARLKAELFIDLAAGLSACGWIEASGVHHDAHAFALRRLGDLLELTNEGLRVARAGRLHPLSSEDGERELGEIIPCEKIERPALDHLSGSLESITKKRATISDA